MFERIRRSIELTRVSWRILMQDKELAFLPVLSGAAIVVACALYILPVVAAFGGELPEGGDESARWLALLPLYVGVYAISIFFQSAVVAGASERMSGGDPTVSSALAAAWRRKGAILAWGLVAGTVGVILRAVQERSELLGRIAIALVGAAWSLATFFVVPVIVLEGRGVKESFGASVALFRQRWGEAVLGSSGIGLFGMLLCLPLAALVALLASLDLVVVAAVVGIVGAVALSTLLSTLQGIFVAVLYRYARTAEAPAGVPSELLRDAFRRRG